MTAYGYIRKSVVHDPTRTLSMETQEAEIRRLAEYHRDPDVVILSDLDVSGKKDRGQRPGWHELLTAIESGDAHAVYSYSLSRLSRKVKTLAEFFDLCAERNVPIRLARDEISTGSATGKMHAHMLAAVAQFESDIASERVTDAFAAKRAKDPSWTGPGQPDYGRREGENVNVVVEAFRTAGSFDGAARLLNEREVPTRVKGAAWTGSTVGKIIRRVAPDEVPNRETVRGAPAGTRSFRLARVLVCSVCGTYMTGSKDTRDGHIRYQCRRARTVPHPRAWVAESLLLPLVAREAERAAVAVKRSQVGSAADEAEARALADRRSRVLDMYETGDIDRAEKDRRVAAIAEAESRLTTRRWVKTIPMPPTIETDPPSRVNDYLRRLLVSATVDMSRPTRKGRNAPAPELTFQWRDPSIRADDDAMEGDADPEVYVHVLPDDARARKRPALPSDNAIRANAGRRPYKAS